ncbi:hypothetical protein [Streptomyces sp. NBC_00370]|uniref:hypothetical protein n=1 Tax=Streptomyces sp. NBC_00370 TaxID=2975728 RepID=UPI002E26C3BD
MDTSNKSSLTAALAVGYMAGRTKKGKLVLALLSVAAARGVDPTAAVGQGVGKLTANPLVGQLVEQMRGELLDAGRAALSATTSRGISSLTGALQQRTGSLPESETDEDEEQDGELDEVEEQAEEEDDEVEPPRSSRRRPVRRAEKPTDRAPGPKNPPAKKAMARKAADRKTQDEKARASRAARQKSPAHRSRHR